MFYFIHKMHESIEIKWQIIQKWVKVGYFHLTFAIRQIFDFLTFY